MRRRPLCFNRSSVGSVPRHFCSQVVFLVTGPVPILLCWSVSVILLLEEQVGTRNVCEHCHLVQFRFEYGLGVSQYAFLLCFASKQFQICSGCWTSVSKPVQLEGAFSRLADFHGVGYVAWKGGLVSALKSAVQGVLVEERDWLDLSVCISQTLILISCTSSCVLLREQACPHVGGYPLARVDIEHRGAGMVIIVVGKVQYILQPS